MADVKIGFPPPIGDAVIAVAGPDGRPGSTGPGLLLIVEKQPTGNTLDVTRNVEKALDDLRPGLKGVDLDPTIFRPATFIERSLDNLKEAMIVGCVLVVIILVSFLYRLADGLDQPDRDPALARRGDDRPGLLGRDDQHDGPGRPGDRDG